VDAEAVTRLRSVIGRLSRHFNASSTGEGLTPSQASVLLLVSARGPLGIAELTELEGLNPTMLSRVVSKLDEAGLIERSTGEKDLRSVQVSVTAAGRLVEERIRVQRASVVEGAAERLSDEQLETVVQALPALEALADELRRDSTRPR
jgi:DNA-binding MarR family transcriptional regulator